MMSLNIPKVLIDVSTSVKVTVDVNAFGPRQRVAFLRMLKTGVLKGYSAPVLVARNLRVSAGLPTIWFISAITISLYNMEGEDFWKRIEAGIVSAELQGAPEHVIERARTMLDKRQGTGYMYGLKDIWGHVLKGVSLPEYPYPIGDTVVIDVIKEF